MASKNKLISGLARYAKIVGEPRPGYGTEPGNGPPEWTFDLVLATEQDFDLVKKAGFSSDYIKEDKASGDKYIRFSRKAKDAEGSDNTPFPIVDHRNESWGKDLIGNGSRLNVAIYISEITSKGKKKNKPYCSSIQVWDLIKYVAKSPFAKKDLDFESGDVPFEDVHAFESNPTDKA